MKWLFFLLVGAPLVSGAVIDTAITTAVMQGSFADITSQYVISSEGVEDLAVRLPADVQEVTADMDDVSRTCKIENETALCGSTKTDRHVFTVHYVSHSVIGKLDDRVVFKFDDELPFRAVDHTLILKLPVGSVIPQDLEKDADFFVSPKPSEVLSDGQRIIITWTAQDTRSIAVSAVTEPLARTSWLAIVIGIAAAVLASAGVSWYMLGRRKSKKEVKVRKKAPKVEQKEEKKELVPRFIENEQKVVDLLSAAKGKELWQKQLLAETQFSKAKLSRVIRNLEERGVVKKTIYGNTNKISLKE